MLEWLQWPPALAFARASTLAAQELAMRSRTSRTAAIVAALLSSACATPKLHAAVEARDLGAVRRLLDAGEKVDARDPKEKLTALGWAAANGSAEIASLLIARGADVNAANGQGYRPLHNAAYFHRGEVVTLLLAKGADPSARTSDGQTPLHRALSRYGLDLRSPKDAVPDADLEAMMGTAILLVEGGAEPKAALPTGETALHLAALTGHRPLVAFLLERGVAVDAKGTDGITALYAATTAGRLDAAEELLAHGAQVDARTRSRYTPLWFAARSGAPKLAALLIEKGADVNATDAEGTTPLLAALGTASLASPAGEKLMRSRGASPAQVADQRRRLATVEGRWREVAIDLLAHGADVRAHPPEGPSALLLASVTGDEEAVRALLERGAPIDEVTTGETALHAAIAERQAAVVALLLEKGASVSVVNMSRRTPLHFAAFYLDDPSIVDAIVARGADVHARDSQGNTPLEYAVSAKNERAARALRAHMGR